MKTITFYDVANADDLQVVMQAIEKNGPFSVLFDEMTDIVKAHGIT